MSSADLYRFAMGADVWTYTSGDAAIEHNGETYQPVAIDSSGTEQTTEINRANIEITLPRDNPVAALFIGDTIDAITAVTVFRHQGGAVSVRWKGRVASGSATASEVTLECESIFTALRQPGLRGRYQRSCRHTLYGRGCLVDKALHAVVGHVSAVAGAVVTVPEAAAFPDGTFYGGMLETYGGRVARMILAHEGNQLTLSRPLAELVPAGYGQFYGQHYGAAAVQLYPGCDRSRQTCHDRFANILNFGGFPWIPGRNPFDGNSIV